MLSRAVELIRSRPFQAIELRVPGLSSPHPAGRCLVGIAPGAFDDVMGDDVLALFNHVPSFVLGRNDAKAAAMSSNAANESRAAAASLADTAASLQQGAGQKAAESPG